MIYHIARRVFLGASLSAVAMTCTHVAAQDFPTRPIRIIMPYAAGGMGELFARSIVEKMSKSLGQPIVIEPRPGANSNIGTAAVLAAPTDGYTWVIAAPALTANPSIQKGLWNPVADFSGVGVAVFGPNLITVPASLPVNSLKELVALAKAKPGSLDYGNPGNGSSPHLNAELLKYHAGISMVNIPYKGQVPVITDLISGRLAVSFLSIGLAMPHITSGRLKGLAVVANKRSKLLPNVPTVSEAGYQDANVVPWYGFAVRSGTPPEIKARINAAFNEAIKAPEVIDSLEKLGLEPAAPRSLAEIQVLLKSDYERYKSVIEAANIKPE